MEHYKQEFIEFMVDCKALKFGDFVLKSGRRSPFFMNAGSYVTGGQLRRLGGWENIMPGPSMRSTGMNLTSCSGLHTRESL